MASTLAIDMRPREFVDVIGLEPQVAVIRNKIATGDIPRAILLTGPFGCGKTTLAYIIAKEIQGFEFADITPQVQEINAASMRGIDAMRSLAERAASYPMVGKYGVIILDEVHQLSKDAQQLLLKEFEQAKSPTVWIVCTTNPEKLNEGVRDRCFAVPAVNGMGPEARAALVARAVKQTGYAGDTTPFLAALAKAKIVSPRKILKAFEGLNNGLDAKQAVAAACWEVLPEYWEIAMGTVFGQWEKGYTLPWIRDAAGQPRQFKAVCNQLAALDEKLKKKKDTAEDTAPAADEDDAVSEAILDDEDVQNRPEASRALRAIVAATLKNQIVRDSAKFNAGRAMKAAEALQIISHCISPSPFDTGLEFAATMAGLYRVNQKMQGK